MRRRLFILTEAAATLPLVRRILVDVREARARLCRLKRGRPNGDERRDLSARLVELLAEAGRIGVEITPGVRCEALFPFEHQWIGPKGDGQLRLACFVYSDAEPTIRRWAFAGWLSEPRPCPAEWWRHFRPGQSLPRRRAQPT